MANKYKIKCLSKEFSNRYPINVYPEFEEKESRPYVVFLVEIKEHTFAIPFRTNMNHNYGYKFKNSTKDTKAGTGLDFTKAVIVDDERLIGQDAFVNKEEFKELSNKYYFIINKFEKYIDGYLKYVDGELDEFKSKAYKFSTLRYYHNELNIKC